MARKPARRIILAARFAFSGTPVRMVSGSSGGDDSVEVGGVAREDWLQVLIAGPLAEHLAEDIPIIGCDAKITGGLELILRQSRPLSVNLTAFNGVAQQEHHAAAPVIGPQAIVLVQPPPK